MTCSNVNEMLAAYLDGETTGEERSRIENHLSACDKCIGELKELGATQNSLRQALKTFSKVEPSPAVWNTIRERLETPDSFWEKLSRLLNNPGVRMAMPVAVLVFLAAGLMWKGVIFSIPTLPALTPVTTSDMPAPGHPAPVPIPTPLPSQSTALPPLSPLPPTTPSAPVVTVTPPAQPQTVSGEAKVTISPAPEGPAGPAGPAGPDTPPTTTTPPAANTPPPAGVTLPPISNNVTVPPPAINVAPAQVNVQPPNVTVNPPQVTVQPPPPANVAISPPQVVEQAPPPAAVTVTPPVVNLSIPAYLNYLIFLPIGLAVALVIVLLLPRRKG